MTRSAPARSRRRTARTTLLALLALALVSTAHAPSVITIRPGDTLWELARKHGTSESALRSLNGITGGTIYAGRTLRVPAHGSSGGSGASSSGEVSHRVRSGETLSGIAQRYGVSQSAIARRNSLRAGRIYAGTTIAVPRGSGGSTAAAASTAAGSSSSPTVRPSVAENRRVLAARSHPSKAEVRRMVAATARRYGVSPSLAVAVAYQESGFQQRVVSGANAIGVMQVLPSTGRNLSRQHGMSLDLFDTQDNITAGVLLLRQLIRSEGTAEGALAGYYQGLGSIARQGVLPQTHAYIRNIEVLRGRFSQG